MDLLKHRGALHLLLEQLRSKYFEKLLAPLLLLLREVCVEVVDPVLLGLKVGVEDLNGLIGVALLHQDSRLPDRDNVCKGAQLLILHDNLLVVGDAVDVSIKE